MPKQIIPILEFSYRLDFTSLCVPLREARLGRHPGVAAPVDKRSAKENTTRGQTREAAYSATSRAEVEGITGERPMDNRQQTDR